MHDPTTAEPAEERTDPERFDPVDDGGRLVDAEHRARYLVGAALAKDRRVLDAACGTGYGTAMLLDAGAADVVALDIAPEALEATHRRVGDRAELVEGNLHALPFDDGSFDLVVCLEAIEHVDNRDGVLDELRRVTAPGGLLLLSSPNRDVYPPGNPHHIEEYTPDEMAEALGTRFKHIHLLRQHPWLASAVDSGEREAPAVARLAKLAPGAETYTLALASNEPLPSVHGQVVLADAFEVRWWHERLEEMTLAAARTLEAERQANVLEHSEAETRAELAAAGERLLELERQLVDATDLRRRYDEVVEERASFEQEVEKVFAEKDAALDVVVSSLSWRVTRPLRALMRIFR